MVNADWHMNLNCSAGNRIKLQAERTAVVTVAALCAWNWDRAGKTPGLKSFAVVVVVSFAR